VFVLSKPDFAEATRTDSLKSLYRVMSTSIWPWSSILAVNGRTSDQKLAVTGDAVKQLLVKCHSMRTASMLLIVNH